MKRILLILVAIATFGTISAQRTPINGPKGTTETPAVTMTATYVGEDSFTIHFQPNADCHHYVFVTMTDADIAMWTGMMGMTVDQLVVAWGITAYGDTTYTWNEMEPNQTHKILAVAYDNANTAYPYTFIEVNTNAIGGHGLSVIDITVSNITETSAFVTCTPNDQTALFYDGLVTVEYYDMVGADSACTVLRENCIYPYYSTDAWEWSSLTENTDYYAIAFGQNVDGQWGDTTRFAFSTLNPDGIQDNQTSPIVIYPMPSNGNFNLAGSNLSGCTAQLFSINGQLLREITLDADNTAVSCNLPAGQYLLRVIAPSGNALGSKTVIIR